MHCLATMEEISNVEFLVWIWYEVYIFISFTLDSRIQVWKLPFKKEASSLCGRSIFSVRVVPGYVRLQDPLWKTLHVLQSISQDL